MATIIKKKIKIEPPVGDEGFGKLLQWMSVFGKAVGLKIGYFQFLSFSVSFKKTLIYLLV